VTPSERQGFSEIAMSECADEAPARIFDPSHARVEQDIDAIVFVPRHD
jgi:hypothetical protein